MRLRLPVDRFEGHLALFYLLHVGVPLKGECHMSRNFLRSARAADGES